MINFNSIIPFYLASLIFIVSFFMLYKYYETLKNQEKYIKYVLIFLRSASIFLFLLILIQPVISLNTKVSENKKIAFFIDNSKSMSYHIEKNKFTNQLKSSIMKLKDNNIDFDFYLFGDTVRRVNEISEINFIDEVTNLNQVSETIKYLDANEYIIISDGMENQSIMNFEIRNNDLLNTFGIGSLYKEEDLSIQSRVLGFADIFEALTAPDRPYKKSNTLKESLDIMYDMCNIFTFRLKVDDVSTYCI